MDKKYVELSNGERIYYIDQGDSTDIFVMLHGNMSSSVHFKPLIEGMSDDYRIIAPDLRGFGDSTYNNPINGLEDLGEDVFVLLEALQITKYHLLGWSTGGAIAMKMAAQRPKSVRSLVLIESCSYRGYPIFKKDKLGQPLVGQYYDNKAELAQDAVQVKPMVDLFESNNVAVMKMIWDQVIYTVNKPSKEDDDLYLSETMKQKNIVDIDWGLTCFNMSNFSNGVTLGDGTIKNVTCPVLTFWGDKDITVLEYMIDETVEALEDVTKITLQNCGHSPLVDCPEELIISIKKFTL